MQTFYRVLLIVSYLIISLSCDLFAGNIPPRGYLILQGVSTYNQSKYGAISTEADAEKLFSQLSKDYTNFGITWSSLYYDEKDLQIHTKIGKIAQKYNIDLWFDSFRLLDRIRAFGDFDDKYQSSVMLENGSIVPAVKDGKPLFDVLNESAATWFVDQFRNKYLLRFKGTLRGYIINEEPLTYLGEVKNYQRYDYWRNPCYSRAVLDKWRLYTKNHGVIYSGKFVDKFPVHKPEMVAHGGGVTQYFPGYNVPESISPGQKFVQLPKNKGVWKHWDDFICELYLNNWISRIATAANDVNKDNPSWHGVMFFGLHHWSLPYEEISDNDFKVPQKHKWGAWGRQRGLDLDMIVANKSIDIVVCETFPPINANLEYYVREFKRISDNHRKVFGVMLHRDDKNSLDVEEENLRWDLINKYKPTIIMRYPYNRSLRSDALYSLSLENKFKSNLQSFRSYAK